ncbi:hypothetical protein [Caulobacter soli]|uniref:hypothetical protein n=1 Tax=Caulobacter soli TaxID=2708539 RepID=UPI00196AE718|nr:hypothetical protein [Caulobacter soli]
MRASVIGKLGAAAALLVGLGAAWPGGTFTQSVSLGVGNAIPMGHEWLTRMAAIEVLGVSPVAPPDQRDPNDPRRGWGPRTGGAWNIALNTPGAQAEAQRLKGHAWNDTRYASRYKAVHDAIIGERWVDFAGYNVITAKTCWDAVAQEPADIQYDHFMRRYDDVGGAGGVNAAKASQQRFIQYFVAAATAPKTAITVYDGGATGSAAVTVDKNYFLFGRAVHLFEDSFSSEHTVRVPEDNFIKVRQVKSYVCALGSEQHTHAVSAILNYSSGDVIWKNNVDSRLNPTWTSYKASNMKPVALVATEATKDLWAAFIRTMGLPADQRADAARKEAQTLVDHWLSYDKDEMTGWYDNESHRDASYVLAAGQSGKGKTQAQCMAGLDVGTTDQMTYIRKLEADQKQCLYNAVPWAGYQDQFDPQLHTWFSWRWRNGPTGKLLDPPAGWQIQNQPADTGIRVRIKSVANQQYMIAPGGISNGSWIYNRPGAPLDFVVVGPQSQAMFRSAADPLLFLDYRVADGAMKLYAPGVIEPASYDLKPAGQGRSIRSTYWNNYVWLKGDEPYLTGAGNPGNANAQWKIEGLP